MSYLETYQNLFISEEHYNDHVVDKGRYDYVLNHISKNNYQNMIDISSGRGCLIKYIKKENINIDITSTDLFKFNNIKDIKFIQLDLTNTNDYTNITQEYDLLTCLDVLEHVEEEFIDQIFELFTRLSDNFCFSIANHSDIHNDVELHLIQKEKDWWTDKILKYFKIIETFNYYPNLYNYILIRS